MSRRVPRLASLGAGVLLLGVSLGVMHARSRSAPDANEAAGDEQHAAQSAAAERAGEKPEENHLVHIDAEVQERLGLSVVTLESASLRPESTALGLLEADPAQSFTVRAPVAGVVVGDSEAWPSLGAVLADRDALGAIQPRLTPAEQLDLTNQTIEARAQVKETEAELAAARASYDSKLALNANGKMVSDRQLEEAESRVKSNEARLAAAQRKLDWLEERRNAPGNGLAPEPIIVPRGGQVVESPVAPGEFVDAGQVLLRVARFERLVARVELPLGETWSAPSGASPSVRVIGDGRIMPAAVLGRAAQAGSDTRGEAWLLAVRGDPPTLRPGMPVAAHLPQAGEPLRGVLVPEAALVRYGGLTWVFARADENGFERRAVRLYSPTPSGWFVTEGAAAGDTIVATGAQALLSEELKEQIEAEAEAAE